MGSPLPQKLESEVNRSRDGAEATAPNGVSRELGGCQGGFFRPDGVMEVLPCPILLQVEPLAEDIAKLP
jgi:hypothetical protein